MNASSTTILETSARRLFLEGRSPVGLGEFLDEVEDVLAVLGLP